jgi:hypothetical protein
LATKAIEGGVDVKKKGKKKVGKLKPHSNGPNELNNNDLVVLKKTHQNWLKPCKKSYYNKMKPSKLD